MTKELLEILLPFLQQMEGFSSRPYRCAGYFLTIGYGHRLVTGESLPIPLSREEGLVLLQKDIEKRIPLFRSLISTPLLVHQECALLSFAYNIGMAALQRSTLRLKVRRGEHDAVPEELMRWVWAGGKISHGLKKRRFEEGILYETGQWSCSH